MSLADGMVKRGVTKGDPVFIFAEDRSLVMTAMLSSLLCGALFVPMLPDTRQEELDRVIRLCQPRHVLVERACRLSDTFSRFDSNVQLIELEEFVNFRPDESVNQELSVQLDPDDPAYIFFTSGSAGTPKGIVGRLKAIDHFIRWEIGLLKIGPDERVSQLTVPTFDAFLRDAFVALCSGGTSCIPEDPTILLDGERLLEWIDRERISLIHCVPSLFRTLFSFIQDSGQCRSLRHILLSGEQLFSEDIRKWCSVFGDRIQLVNLYGPSETTMTKFAYFVRPADQHRRSVPIGKPIDGARALVVDENNRPCPTGAVGEIYIRTPYRSLGYYKNPELTNRMFVQNPFVSDPNDLVYRTGDFARILDDENFEFVGRRDGQVKIRGVRIELAEVENVLRECSTVKNCVVLDQRDTQNNAYLCAYLVLSSGTPDDVRGHAASRLPFYLLPNAFIQVEALPLTTSGKIDRRALARLYSSAIAERTTYQPPGTPREQALVDIWSDVLGIQRLGINDNFFEIGGHSLLAMQVISRIRKSLKVELSVRSIFVSPTIAALAKQMERDGNGAGHDERTNLSAVAENQLASILAEIEQMSDDEMPLLGLTNNTNNEPSKR